MDRIFIPFSAPGKRSGIDSAFVQQILLLHKNIIQVQSVEMKDLPLPYICDLSLTLFRQQSTVNRQRQPSTANRQPPTANHERSIKIGITDCGNTKITAAGSAEEGLEPIKLSMHLQMQRM